MKKPPRLGVLILSQIAVGFVIALVGYQSSGLSGLWTSATLACFFTAHSPSLGDLLVGSGGLCSDDLLADGNSGLV